MVKITADGGKTVQKVTKGSYHAFYKPLGYTIVGEGKSTPAAMEPQDDGLEGREKPFEEMDETELRQLAAEIGLDVSGLDTIKRLRRAIKKAMAE